MDAQQEEVRERIGALLQEDWFAAVGDCERLLDDTSTTLRELNEVLLRDSAHLQALLQDIEQAATDAEAVEAVAQAQKVQEHLDRVSAWGGDRQRAWSDYYQFVQRYLRGVVRLDPDRAVSQRLRDQLAGWLDRPFALIAAGEPSIRLLRDDQARVERPPVTRRSVDRDHEPEIVPPDPSPVSIEDRVADALASGAATLAELSEAVLREIPVAEQYRAAGRVAELAVTKAGVSGPRERLWQRLASVPLEVEDWELGARRDA
jgi:chromosome partition protein MukF